MTKAQYTEYVNKYTEFMYNPSNEYNCSECPENLDLYDCGNPCGQQNCWVTCHCKENKKFSIDK